MVNLLRSLVGPRSKQAGLEKQKIIVPKCDRVTELYGAAAWSHETETNREKIQVVQKSSENNSKFNTLNLECQKCMQNSKLNDLK